MVGGIDVWWGILKKPYTIETDRDSWKFNKLYQGSQGDKDTGYWTPQLTEALVYAFLGSETGKIKDASKPMIKQALMTQENKKLEFDYEYDVPIDGKLTPRGIAIDNIDFKYLPDSRVKELAEETLNNLIDEIDGGYDGISYDEEEAIKNSAGVSFEEAKTHFEHMLEKYFLGG